MKGEPLAAVVSAGMTRFGKLPGFSARELFAMAFKEALDRCPELDPRRDIQAVFVGNMAGEGWEHQGHWGPICADWAGLVPKPATRFENACASSGAAFRWAVLAIKSGLIDIALVGGVEKMTHRTTPESTEFLAFASDHPFEQFHGLTFPGLYALMAVAHMHRYGTTEEQLAMVAVKAHKYGALNPKAHFQKPVTLEKALSSRVIAWPLKLYDCCPISDGAACAILVRPDLAKRFTDTPVYVIATGQGSDYIGLYEREDLTTIRATVEAARQAYRMAGIEEPVKELDVVEVHDCFTIAEIIAYEDLGFCRKGEGGKMVEEGRTDLDGDIPVNVSGGLKSKGHPVGATGAAQIYEMFLQLRGEAERGRQVPDAEVGLAHNVGGSGASCVVHIFRRG